MSGVTLTLGGSVLLRKDANNNIGISIGGGSPCPCLYVVQIFDRTPAAVDGTLESGDEISGINGKPVKGMTKVELARQIQALTGQVKIHYNKLNLDPSLNSHSVDIAMKKVKHRIVEQLQPSTADLLGLSRAILCNDDLVAKLGTLETKGKFYKELIKHLWRLLVKSYHNAAAVKNFGEGFVDMAMREPSLDASEAFRTFGSVHSEFERHFAASMKTVKFLMGDLKSFLYKVLPDMRSTVNKYANAKFEYLSYCLKVKELEDEETFFNAIREPLYRVETGNLPYRQSVRLRQLARKKFAKLRYDVQVKLELLESKHVEHLVGVLQRFVGSLELETSLSLKTMETSMVFPIDVDLQALIAKTYTEIDVEDDDVSLLSD